MKAPTTYTRLTRNAAGVGTYSSLWLAADHLMIVRSSGYHESYARLQLRDMKGIFLTTTDRRLGWGFFWSIIAIWGLLVVVISLLDRQAPIFSAIALVFGTTGLVWNHLLGQGCRAFVLTGVQTAELPALVRMKKARRVLMQIQPLIAQAQADLVVPIPTASPPSAPAPIPGATPTPAPAPAPVIAVEPTVAATAVTPTESVAAPEATPPTAG